MMYLIVHAFTYYFISLFFVVDIREIFIMQAGGAIRLWLACSDRNVSVLHSHVPIDAILRQKRYSVRVFVMMVMMTLSCHSTASYCSKRKLSKSTMWYIITITILFLGAPLELYEFPPLFGHFDGHSLWHLAGGIISVAFHLHTVADAADYIDEYAYAKLH